MSIFLLVFWICSAAPAVLAAEGVDADVGLADAAAKAEAEHPEMRDAQRMADERRERWRRQPPAQAEGAEALDDGAMSQMLARVPSGPPYMDDLRREAAEEKGEYAMENIKSAAEVKATADARDLYRNYLIQAFFYGHAGTDVGQLIHRGLTSPGGWRAFPTMAHGAVPPGAAATWSGGHITIGPGGDAMVVVSHEWYHHTGHPDDGPDSAYVWMGREFGGGSGLPGSGGNGVFGRPDEGSLTF